MVLLSLFSFGLGEYFLHMPGILLPHIGEHNVNEVIPCWFLGIFIFESELFELRKFVKKI